MYLKNNSNDNLIWDSIVNMKCADFFHDDIKSFIIIGNYTKHITKKDLKDFLDLASDIGAEVNFDTRKLSFNNIKEGKLITKLFRYYRCYFFKERLLKIIELRKLGFPLTTSLILGHYINNEDNYYSPMDMIFTNCISIDRGDKDFRENFKNTIYINNFWNTSFVHIRMARLRQAMKDKNYKKASFIIMTKGKERKELEKIINKIELEDEL